MNKEDIEKSIAAHLYIDGKPLVLNYELMEHRLKRPRLTRSQRAEYIRQRDNEGGFLTVADDENIEPLMIHFRSEHDRYTARVGSGKFWGYFLSMENMRDVRGRKQDVRHLVALEEKSMPTRFFIEPVASGLIWLRNVRKDFRFNSLPTHVEPPEDPTLDQLELYQKLGVASRAMRTFYAVINDAGLEDALNDLRPGRLREFLLALPAVDAKSSIAFAEIEKDLKFTYTFLRSYHDEINAPTYRYTQAGRTQDYRQHYFSDSFLGAENVMWNPRPQPMTLEVVAKGVRWSTGD
ncbi:hypothetical protein SAMN04487857_10275 [Pseudomonas sp. ok272]|uniref:hypothetical protein n=1 Tax=unclassified Pseudomonas TaxID=196821 RepID=UPI0008B4BCEA|nr:MULTISPECIES: hypothetical protein [unclassified Pseudomonas]SEM45423.1 hypothetical protein SAMN04487857_10275 [Pseudomonas sp. ok272]SFM17168.1 hypothetical protein SAMN04487858_10176 [Pseudomonas sp. ok602]